MTAPSPAAGAVSRPDRALPRRTVWAVLLGAMVSTATFILLEERGLTFFVDEWTFGFGGRTNATLADFLTPDNGHLTAIPILIQKVSLQLFGAETTLPLRLVSLGLHLLTAAFLFGLLRRRLGEAFALMPTLLFLVLGSAWDVLIGSHAIPIQLAVCAGMASWWCLEHEGLPWDVAAAVALTIGIASNGFALPFLVIVAVTLALDRPRRWERLWIVAVPLVLYGVWYLRYSGEESTGFALANVAALPSFAFDSLASELAALSGLFTEPGTRGLGFDVAIGRVLAAAGIAACAWLVARHGADRPGLLRALLPPACGLVTLWLITGVVASPERQPFSSRYLYGGCAIVLVLAAGLIAMSAARRRASIALAVVCAVALLPNIRALVYGADFLRLQSDINRGVLAGADLVGSDAAGGTPLEDPANEVHDGVPDLKSFDLEQYVASRERFGSPALSTAQLREADPLAREAADRFMIRALGIAVRPAGSPPRTLRVRDAAEQTGGVLKEAHGCLVFTPQVAEAQLTVPLASSGLWLRPAPGSPVEVGLMRFADGPVVMLRAPGGRSSVVAPAAGGLQGWTARVSTAQRVAVCGS